MIFRTCFRYLRKSGIKSKRFSLSKNLRGASASGNFNRATSYRGRYKRHTKSGLSWEEKLTILDKVAARGG